MAGNYQTGITPNASDKISKIIVYTVIKVLASNQFFFSNILVGDTMAKYTSTKTYGHNIRFIALLPPMQIIHCRFRMVTVYNLNLCLAVTNLIHSNWCVDFVIKVFEAMVGRYI